MKLNSKIQSLLVFILILGLFFFLNRTLAAQKIKHFFYIISEPFQTNLWRAGERVSDFFEIALEMNDLKKKNKELELEILKLLSENVKVQELEKENEDLREALGLELEKEFQLKIAKTLGKDISQDFILINKGSKDGLIEGLPVINPQKILIGKISTVYPRFSKVMLVSNKESLVDVEVYERDVEGVAKGKGNLQISLELLPKEKEIKENDLIVTTSLSGAYPKGLLVGQIKEVKKQDIEPFQAAEIKPAFEINQIENLLIITDF